MLRQVRCSRICVLALGRGAKEEVESSLMSRKKQVLLKEGRAILYSLLKHSRPIRCSCEGNKKRHQEEANQKHISMIGANVPTNVINSRHACPRGRVRMQRSWSHPTIVVHHILQTVAYL